MAIYLCIISLVEKEIADFNAMSELVSKYNCDIRRSLLQVQYLVSSGGLHNLSTQNSKRISVRQSLSLRIGVFSSDFILTNSHVA